MLREINVSFMVTKSFRFKHSGPYCMDTDVLYGYRCSEVKDSKVMLCLPGYWQCGLEQAT